MNYRAELGTVGQVSRWLLHNCKEKHEIYTVKHWHKEEFNFVDNTFGHGVHVEPRGYAHVFISSTVLLD